jgi:hypothetical protein
LPLNKKTGWRFSTFLMANCCRNNSIPTTISQKKMQQQIFCCVVVHGSLKQHLDMHNQKKEIDVQTALGCIMKPIILPIVNSTVMDL